MPSSADSQPAPNGAPALHVDSSADVDTRRGLFCNRTLNLRSIQAIGYDMDYTLVHYRMREWERRAYAYIKEGLQSKGWPVGDLELDPDLVIRGLILDTEEGNVVKANRFGYVKRAYHGTEPMPFERQRDTYQRTLVDLSEERWTFLNTLFTISAGCMYMQLVDLLDAGQLSGSMGYADLFDEVQHTLDEAHMEGRLKEEIIDHPERFVDLDEEMPLALLDQKRAGKKILLITNSEWGYAKPMLEYAFDAYLPEGMTWRDLFDLSIVGARKPDFFSVRMPAFKVVSDDGLLREHQGLLDEDCVYVGGNAGLVEESLGLKGEEILYVGDHLFVDVNVSKSVSRWRTALVVRELEDEIEALEGFAEKQERLSELMAKKERLEARYSALRLQLQRRRDRYGPRRNGQVTRAAAEASASEASGDGSGAPTNGVDGAEPVPSNEAIEKQMSAIRERLVTLDDQIAPLAKASSRLLNENWGPLMRTGKDKSLFARQVERYADIYTARVSNFLHHTPFIYLRSHRGSLPHDTAAESHVHSAAPSPPSGDAVSPPAPDAEDAA